MKKTLAAVAVLGAFAGSALAADVQLYGIVDLGVGYNHVDADGLGKDSDSFGMKSGQASGSRWGIKGTEDLGNGLTVGFILENGFTADDGVDSEPMFNRESSLFLEGGFGKVAFGRIGSINNGQSSWAKVGMISAFGTSDWGGYSAQVGNIMATAGQWDNMIAYQTPSFAGFKLYAQYGMGNQVTETYDKNITGGTGGGTVEDEKTYGVENESSSNRYYAIGATYNNGPFAAYFAVDSINYSSVTLADGTGALQYGDTDDSLTVTLGGSYDFEVVKVYLGAQYFDEVALDSMGGVIKALKAPGYDTMVKGYAVSLSADAPLWGGKGMIGFGYTDAESADSEISTEADVDLQRYVVSLGYDYSFSKRTDVYAVASWMMDSYENKVGAKDGDPSACTLYVGLRHRF